LEQALIFYQGLDSAHISTESSRWLDEHGIKVMDAPLTSPDLSVMETWVKPLRKILYAHEFRGFTESSGTLIESASIELAMATRPA
jgi:hypothetical protein